MYNKNGLILLNRAKTTATSNLGVALSSGDTIQFTNGTTTSINPAIYYTTGTMTAAQAAQSLAKINITGADHYTVYSNPDFVDVALIPGYRSAPFDENTFAIASPAFSSYASISTSYGIPTLAIVNSSASDIVVNNIDVIIKMRDFDSSSNKNAIIAGFSFPDVTIPTGESYTFTIMHKNN